ncbi:hypothetical protein TCAL_14731 [Tigriopus californicus]|uniref:Ionotropic glutamate receptor L-glutamate and glycine-binding domain-containing protein n=1 Tax=Tigriopus californicus TaxID=6832 RepID=A0A553PEX2_TIGCA|nr:hypothetical protein TCAL_14731 [Tigriopus californicus]
MFEKMAAELNWKTSVMILKDGDYSFPQLCPINCGFIKVCIEDDSKCAQGQNVSAVFSEVPISRAIGPQGSDQTAFILPISQDLNSLFIRLDSHIYLYEDHGSTIFEAWRFKDNPIQIGVFGELQYQENVTNFIRNKKPMWRRRRDLMGSSIREATVSKIGRSVYSQEFFNFMKHMSQVMNFTLQEVHPVDKIWGNPQPNGSWLGVIGMLQRHEADLSSEALTISALRAEVIDFSAPVQIEKITLGMKGSGRGGETGNFWSYIDVFPWFGWGILLLGFIALFSCLYLLDSTRNWATISLTELVPAALARGASIPEEQIPASLKIARLATWIWGLMGFTFYGGLLTSTMIASDSPNLVTRFEDVSRLGLTLLVEHGTFLEGMLASGQPSTLLNDLYKATDGQSYDSDHVLERLNNVPNTIAILPSQYTSKNVTMLRLDSYFTTALALGFPMGSELIPMFNYHIFLFKESGLLEAEMLHWSNVGRRNNLLLKSETNLNQLGYEFVLFPFLLLSSGVTLSVLLAICERIFITRPPK